MEEAQKRAYYEQNQAQQFVGVPPLPGYGAPTPMAGATSIEEQISRLAEEVAQQARALSDARQDNMRSSVQLSDAEKRFADLSARLSQAMAQHASAGQVNVLR